MRPMKLRRDKAGNVTSVRPSGTELLAICAYFDHFLTGAGTIF
jgi:hypothetical protein